MQFYEIDLPHASTIKQKLVQKVLPDTNEVSQAVLLMPMLINHLLSHCKGLRLAAPSFACSTMC